MDFEWQSSASKTVPANLGLMGSALHESQNLIFSSSMCMGEAATKFIMNKFCTFLRDTRARHNYISPCPMLTSCDLSFTCALISCSSVLLVNPLCRNCSWVSQLALWVQSQERPEQIQHIPTKQWEIQLS